MRAFRSSVTYLQHVLVVRKVNRSRLRLQAVQQAASLIAALAEGNKLRRRLLAETRSKNLAKVNSSSLRSHSTNSDGGWVHAYESGLRSRPGHLRPAGTTRSAEYVEACFPTLLDRVRVDVQRV